MGEKRRKILMVETEPKVKSKRPVEKIKRTAYHESGHVVLNLLMGLPFDEVSIDTLKKDVYEYREGQKEKLTYLVTKGVSWPKDRTESVNKDIMAGILNLREALSSMAGPQAEALLVNAKDEEAQFGAKNDMQTIAACCRAAIAPGVSVANWKPTIMEEHILQSVALQAADILKQNWERLEVIANALLECKKLTYSEAEALFTKSNGR